MNRLCILISQKSLFTLLLTALITFSGCTSDIQNTDGAVVSQALVTIDPTVRYQVIEGWGEGGMDTFTPAWYVLFRPAVHETILDSMYTLKDNGLGLNICRFLVPMGDNPEHDHMNYTIPLANKPFEPEEGVFTWDGHENLLWRAQGAQRRGATMWASFYSPPYWLTVSGCTGGSKDGKTNNLIAGKEKRFAKHICEVVQHFQDAWGVNFEYVSPINEPEADWWKFEGGSPGCHVSDEQAVVVLRELSEQLKKYGLNSKIQAYDAAYGNSYWYMENLLKSEVEPLIEVMSVHQYITSDEALIKWQELATQYNKSLWSTEWGDWANAGYPDNKPYEQALKYANKIHEGLKVLKANAWIIWEPGFIYDANMFYLTPRKAYWAVAHYSRHIRPGFQQIASEDSTEGCKSSAWIGPDKKTLVVVTVNDSSSERSVTYDLSQFKGLKIQELRLTSESQDYAQIEPDQTVQSDWTMNMPSGSIMTMTASIPN
jgi:O-glycosyl hydrolase